MTLKFSTYVLSSLFILSLGACATQEKQTTGDAPTHASFTPQYLGTIDSFSAGEKEYAGFYNNFEFRAVLHNSLVRDLLLNRQAEYYQWDADRLSTEKEKSNQEASSETVVFFSFFTPERKNDNLTDSKSIWRVFLDLGGKRYVGRIGKSRRLIAELQTLYPYHSRWTTPYTATFDLPAAVVDRTPSTFTITGPLGTRTVNFPQVEISGKN